MSNSLTTANNDERQLMVNNARELERSLLSGNKDDFKKVLE